MTREKPKERTIETGYYLFCSYVVRSPSVVAGNNQTPLAVMQTLEQVGYSRIGDLPAAPAVSITTWLSDPQMTDSAFIKQLEGLNLSLAGRSELVIMCTEAGRVGVVEFLEKRGAWNPYIHGDQWFRRIVTAIKSRNKAMIEHTARQYSREAQAPFCVPIDKRVLLASILATQFPSTAKLAIEALGLQHTALLSEDVQAIAVAKSQEAYNSESELGQLVWRHQKSLHLTVTDKRAVAANVYCCDHSAPVDNGQAFKGQFSNILVGRHGYKPAEGKPKQLQINNFTGPYVLLGFVDESQALPVEFYLVGTGTFSEYARTPLKDREDVVDAFSLLQIGASSCHLLVTNAARANPPKALKVDYQQHGCVSLMLPSYALVAVHTIKSADHAMKTSAGHGFVEKLKSMMLGDEQEEGDGKGKEGAKTQARHSSILEELERKFPPSIGPTGSRHGRSLKTGPRHGNKTTDWELTPEAARGSLKYVDEIFGSGGRKPPAPWDSKEPILVNKANPSAVLREIVVDFPADRYSYLMPHRVVLEAKGPDDISSINRMDRLRDMIRTAYLQKKWTEKELKGMLYDPSNPNPGEPWLYKALKTMVEEGLEIDYDLSTKDSVYLTLNFGS